MASLSPTGWRAVFFANLCAVNCEVSGVRAERRSTLYELRPQGRVQFAGILGREGAKMSSTATQPQPNADDVLVKLDKRTKRLSIFAVVLVLLFLLSAVCGVVVLRRKLKAIDAAREDLAFRLAVTNYNALQDGVQPVVNTIQFVRRGYSITFDRVEYTQNGLLLAGRIGNPLQLWVSSLALNFSARPYPYKFRDKIANDDYFLYSNAMDIGTAQTTVGELNPGSTASFEVTIPNVKQTSDSIAIVVSFSGERYQYLK
jgi:hypothetical protein